MDNRSKWEKWRDESFNPVARALKSSPFGTAQILPRGMRVELSKDTPRRERRKLEFLMSEAGSWSLTSTSNRDIIFVRMV